MIPRMPLLLPALAAALACSVQAIAGEQPSAMVESLSQPVTGVAAMDYLAPGATVALAADATMVLDYLASCTRETITGGPAGGTVHVGPQQSTVDHGRVSRRRMDCDGSDLQLTAAQSDTGGVAVYRDIGGPATPSLTLRGTTPMIVARGEGPIRIERLDGDEPAHDLAAPTPVNGRAMLDLAKTDTVLAAGGTYRISQGPRSIVFKIASDAAAGPLPLVLRLLPL